MNPVGCLFGKEIYFPTIEEIGNSAFLILSLPLTKEQVNHLDKLEKIIVENLNRLLCIIQV